MSRRHLLLILIIAMPMAMLPACDRLAEDRFTPRPFDAGLGEAICYGPHRDGQRPGGASPGLDEIREDLRLMAPHWRLLRIYGASGFAETLLGLIREDGLELQVVLGAWIAADAPAANRRELDAAIRLAGDYPEIVRAISVGNETQVSWSGHRSPLDSLILHVRRVRSKTTVPVTAADDFNFWNKPESRRLAAEIDFIMMHAHPMWNGVQLEAAVPWLQDQLTAVKALHPDRGIVIAETGWATTVHDEGEQAELIKGKPGEAEQAAFRAALREWAEAERVSVFYFEAFDENWKGGAHPAEVEKHWGLFRADRTAKAGIEPARAD